MMMIVMRTVDVPGSSLCTDTVKSLPGKAGNRMTCMLCGMLCGDITSMMCSGAQPPPRAVGD